MMNRCFIDSFSVRSLELVYIVTATALFSVIFRCCHEMGSAPNRDDNGNGKMGLMATDGCVNTTMATENIRSCHCTFQCATSLEVQHATPRIV